MSIMVATGKGATHGVLFRDAAAIENLRKVDTLIVDKTGTLTEGRPASSAPVARPGLTPTRCCAWPPAWTRAASTRWRGHRARAREKGSSWPSPRVRVRVRHRRARHGRRQGAGAGQHRADGATGRRRGRATAAQAEAARQGASVMHLAVDGQLAGLLAVSDPIKATTPSAGALRKARACAS
jgi:Cu+-exporting ATPase